MFICLNFSVLLERVFLRIGSADTDAQLEQSLNIFLPPVLLKLSSQQEEVRKKVYIVTLLIVYLSDIFKGNFLQLSYMNVKNNKFVLVKIQLILP